MISKNLMSVVDLFNVKNPHSSAFIMRRLHEFVEEVGDTNVKEVIGTKQTLDLFKKTSKLTELGTECVASIEDAVLFRARRLFRDGDSSEKCILKEVFGLKLD